MQQFVHHPISAGIPETTSNETEKCSKTIIIAVFLMTPAVSLKTLQNNGILTSRQGIGVPNAGRLELPAERHRGICDFRELPALARFFSLRGLSDSAWGNHGGPAEMCQNAVDALRKTT